MTAVLMKSIRIAGTAILAIVLLAIPAMARDDDGDDLGVFIREGSCDEPGMVIEDIGDLDPEDDIWHLIGNDEPETNIVYGEDEGIKMSIDDLTGNDYIVTIHESDDKDVYGFSTYVPCRD